MSDEKRLTPAMEQYRFFKAKYPDAILFFRMGDFYETFETDAETIAPVLGIALTSRSKDKSGKRIPLAGVPYHAAENYIAKLVNSGFKVAICEQVEDPKYAKGVVKRDVVRVITPGTVIDAAFLTSGDSHYLMVITGPNKEDSIGIAFLELSTGEFFVMSCIAKTPYTEILSEIAKYNPDECLIPYGLTEAITEILCLQSIPVTQYDPTRVGGNIGLEVLNARLPPGEIERSGCSLYPETIQAAAMALIYAEETQHQSLSYIRRLSFRSRNETMVLDSITLRNLELVSELKGDSRENTLYSVLNRTKTPMGSRFLKKSIVCPLISREKIEERYSAIQFLTEHVGVKNELQSLLKRCGDIERTGARIAYGNVTPRDLVTLAGSLETFPAIKILLEEGNASTLFSETYSALSLKGAEEAISLIRSSIVDDPPPTTRQGGVIKEGYSDELDKIRKTAKKGRDWVLELQQSERERTGIKSLKIGYTSVFGYYIEVTRANLHLIPPDYQRKQTTTTSERYVTPDLKEKEAQIQSADDKTLLLEDSLYRELIKKLEDSVTTVQTMAHGIAVLDFITALSDAALLNGYIRPVIAEGSITLIRDGRHPVVECRIKSGFVPNDTHIASDKDQILIITGANMAGKSTYMRTVALITIMAQMGSYVPASYAEIGLVDRVFSRVGAFDDLARGQSTFMVEMLELANILTNFTGQSLIILDEIGRGTSTADGLSIAKAVLTYLHENEKGAPRTLFATHFHELIGIENEFPRIKNCHFAVKESGDEIVFKRKLIPGATDRSYGIHVAALAGIPDDVVLLAQENLEDILSDTNSSKKSKKKSVQLLLFESAEKEVRKNPLIEELISINPDEITPLGAITLLYSMRKRAMLWKEGEI